MKPNYEIENYCVKCDQVFSKTVINCPHCHMKLRTLPAAGIRRKKYQDRKARY